VLVAEWGLEAVQRALLDVSMRSPAQIAPEASVEAPNRSRKPTAIQRAARVDAPPNRHEALIAIAAAFDEKKFLPTIGAVKEFLSMNHARPVALKDRLESFRHVLGILAGMPTADLQRILHEKRFSGPARLGPLSDAIRSAGRSIRRSAPEVDRDE
jgi:hypothetical protein